MMNIDFTLANLLLKGLGERHVPISNSIKKSLLHGAMDNFDSIEDTKSGTGSSYVTILHLLRIKTTAKKERSVDKILECQNMLPFCKSSTVGVLHNFLPGSYNIAGDIA